VVIYDPDLTLGLPVAMSVTSGLNAMAHAVGLAREKWRAIASIYAAASNAHGLWKPSAECRRIGL
jgi:alcohol dehydrogenase class IV